MRFDVFTDGQVGAVSGNVVLRHGYGCRGVGTQCDFVVARVYARVCAGFEYAYADLRLGSLAGPVFDGVCEGVRSCGVGISFVYQVGGVDFADASECRRLVAEAEQLHVVAVGVDAGQGDRDLDFLSCCNLCLNVGWCWRRLVFGVFLMHVDGDCGGCRVAEIVFDRVRYGEGSGLVGCLVSYGVA